MNKKEIIQEAESYGSFKNYLFADRRIKVSLWIALFTIMIQFGVFKYLYPNASYIHGDSFSYLEAAIYNWDVNTYMVGYSRFLRFLSVFSKSDMFLVAVQYLLIQGSALFFLFTLFYFYKPSRIVQNILICFMVLNPLFLHLANLVSSDGLFLALSLIWISLLLWIMHRPNKYVIVLHLLVLFLTFTVRYNALFYPIVSILVFILSRQSVKEKVVEVGVSTLLCSLFILYTGNSYKKLTGIWQYSPFSGWQMANNAMYAYRYVDSKERKSVPFRFQKLDNMIRAYFDTTRDIYRHPQEAVKASTIYMWDRRMPLYTYRDMVLGKYVGTTDDFKKWALMGNLYRSYGIYIVKKYPAQYIQYFLWPNAKKYYAPWVEFLSAYNMGADSVLPVAQMWFGYKSTKVTTRMKSSQVDILDFYPVLTGAMNVLFVCSLICFLLLDGFKGKTAFKNGIVLAFTLWIVNAVFTILSSSAALRFQAFPILLVTTFASLLIDWMCRVVAGLKSEETKLDKCHVRI